MAVWGVVLLMGADNIVKPILIARSGQLPLLVLFVGVIGGTGGLGFHRHVHRRDNAGHPLDGAAGLARHGRRSIESVT